MRLVINNLSIKVFMIGLVFTISPLLSFGHNPLSAKYSLEVGEKVSLLTINLSQDGINQALLKKYNRKELEELPSTKFEEVIVEYIKSNFNLSIDDTKILLKKGGIKLGSHQTDLKFVIPPFPKEIKKIEVNIPAFKESGNHQTIFSYNLHGNTDRVILNRKNDYQSTIVLSELTQTNSWKWLIPIGLISLTSIILTIFLKKRKRLRTA